MAANIKFFNGGILLMEVIAGLSVKSVFLHHQTIV